jgi:hypothetical protein
MGSMSMNKQESTIPMRNGVTDFGGAFKTDLEHNAASLQNFSVATLSVHYPKGSTSLISGTTRDHGASRLSTVPKTRSLITIASTFQ